MVTSVSTKVGYRSSRITSGLQNQPSGERIEALEGTTDRLDENRHNAQDCTSTQAQKVLTAEQARDLITYVALYEIRNSLIWQDFFLSIHFCVLDKVSALVSALLLSKTAEKRYSMRKIPLKT